MLKQFSSFCGCALFGICLSGVWAAAQEKATPDTVLVAEAINTPSGTPVIRVVREKLWGKYYPMVSTTFPNVPEFTCDSWCYESSVKFEGARALEHGIVEMRHRSAKPPGLLIVTTIIGAVSRDGKYLTAIANDSAGSMSQAWHDCMHNNPEWLPADAPAEERRWRVKIYAMNNDPDALLLRVGKDFPNAKHVAQ